MLLTLQSLPRLLSKNMWKDTKAGERTTGKEKRSL
jgi:hypothetical protein